MAAKTSEWRPGPTVCRCCLTEGCYKDISTEYFWMGRREVYEEMLKDTLEITISYSKAGGPNSNSRLICEPCISRLRDATEFKRQVVECERMFMHHLDPASTSQEIEVEAAPVEKIKVEGVKLENSHSDDDFGDHHFGDDDDDDDDLDNQPLTKLASKIPKKESVDFLDLLDNSKAAEKRKATSKAKAPPPKKTKTKVEPPSTKPSSSKAKPEKKKKGDPPKANVIITKNEVPNTIPKEKPITIKNECLPKPIATRFLLKSKEVTIKKVPSNNSLAIKRTLLVSPKIKSNLSNTSNNTTNKSKRMPIDKRISMMSCMTLLKNTTLCPFKHRGSSYLCLYCNAKFLDVHEVEDHVKQHESVSEDDIYNVLVRTRVHDRIKLNVKEFGCKICGDVVEDWPTLKQHLAEKHEHKIDPENDGVVLFKINKNNYDCALCDKKFVKYKLLSIHIKEHYKKFFCDQCGTGFITSLSLRHHMKSHESGSYPCNECSKVFKNKIGKDLHYKTVHARAKKNKCNICGEGFLGYYRKLRHLKDVHNAELPEYKCSYCPKVFIMISDCKAHEKTTHLKSACYKCDMCDYKHHIKAILRRHMIVHSGEKSHNCNVCGKAYARKFTLDEHMRIHNNDRRFKCNYCDRAFVQKCSLKGHMKTHHKDVVFDEAPLL